jgi:hypothetical protein
MSQTYLYIAATTASLHVYSWSYREFRDLSKETRPCPLDWQSVKSHVLYDGAPAPALHKLKDFIRFYVKQSKGRIKEHATVQTTLLQAVFFFAGFSRETGTAIKEKDRTSFKVRTLFCRSKYPS